MLLFSVIAFIVLFAEYYIQFSRSMSSYKQNLSPAQSDKKL
ncbi:hypothetical protein JDF658_18140 [Carboxydocella sp. JDF658]|nr:hypothetical protein ULO1_18420 [Carboxydocella sp. ULO1]GAW32049.1 hypothetical protein JDF658_18140 [Carboxydocella sp. JDF658]